MAEPEYNRTLAWLRLASVYTLVATLAYFARPTAPDLIAGMPFVALGEAIRLWASGHLLKNDELVTSGPYRHTRNPMYLGRLLIFTGLCLMSRLPLGLHWAVLAGGLCVFFVYYLPRKERVEPARLRELHGARFEDYRRTVPALFPGLRPFGEGVSGNWSGTRMLVNREHWMVVALLAILTFLFWRAYSPPV